MHFGVKKEKRLKIAKEFREYARNRLEKAQKNHENLDATIVFKQFNVWDKVDVANAMAKHLETPDGVFDLSMFENVVGLRRNSCCLHALADGTLSHIAYKYISSDKSIESSTQEEIRKKVMDWGHNWIYRALKNDCWRLYQTVKYFPRDEGGGAPSLISLKVPRYWKEIEDHSFNQCVKLKEIDLSEAEDIAIRENSFSGSPGRQQPAYYGEIKLDLLKFGKYRRRMRRDMRVARCFENTPIREISFHDLESTYLLNKFPVRQCDILRIRNISLASSPQAISNIDTGWFADDVLDLGVLIDRLNGRKNDGYGIKCIIVPDELKEHILSLLSIPSVIQDNRYKRAKPILDGLLISEKFVNLLTIPYQLSMLNRHIIVGQGIWTS